MRVAIYTAIFGSYDFLKRPAQQRGIHADFYCFSDNADWGKTRKGWRHKYVPADPNQHPRMQAKRFKLLSHEIFPNGRLAPRFSRFPFRPRYDATIWVDASLRIKGNSFAREVFDLCDDNALVVYRHPDRDCVVEEAAVSMTLEKYRGLPLKDQADFYISKGLIEHGGLFACGVVGRSCVESPRVKRFCEAWWAENARWTYQDQVSFAYLAGREDAKINTIPGNLWQNEFFDWIPHRSTK